MQVAQLNPFFERTSSGKLRLPKAALMSNAKPHGTNMRFSLSFFLALTASLPALAGECPVKGPRIQWQADYCMWKMESDDIITADPCMREDAKRHYRDDCEAKKYYQRKMYRIESRRTG